MREQTEGGFLELINEFEVAGGGAVHPHAHPTHEWYYVTDGRGVMTIADEERDVVQGDLVYIPPNVVHSLRPLDRPRADPLLLLRDRRARHRRRSTTRRTRV